MVNYYHIRGKYDSAIVHYRRAIAAFQQAGLDSSRGIAPGTVLVSAHSPWGSG